MAYYNLYRMRIDSNNSARELKFRLYNHYLRWLAYFSKEDAILYKMESNIYEYLRTIYIPDSIEGDKTINKIFPHLISHDCGFIQYINI